MIDNILTASLGILLIVAGYGKVPLSKNPAKNQEYLNKYGAILRIGGIVMTTIGILLAVVKLFTGE